MCDTRATNNDNIRSCTYNTHVLAMFAAVYGNASNMYAPHASEDRQQCMTIQCENYWPLWFCVVCGGQMHDCIVVYDPVGMCFQSSCVPDRSMIAYFVCNDILYLLEQNVV